MGDDKNKLSIKGICEKPRITKILYFTDAHNQPTLSVDRFIWLARLINREKPDYLIDGGDFDDFHSLCTHERDETLKGRLKPSLLRDLEQAAKARNLLTEHMRVSPIKHVTLGNHEARIWKYEDENPAVYGLASGHYTDILEKNGWGWSKYGDYYTAAGVDFTHMPFTGMGKPVGGDNATKQVAEKSIKDVCFGHTHALQHVIAHKFGPARSVTAFNAGCFMPNGYIPSYAQNTRKEFWYGAHVLTIIQERINSIKSYSILELEDLFSREPFYVSDKFKEKVAYSG